LFQVDSEDLWGDRKTFRVLAVEELMHRRKTGGGGVMEEVVDDRGVEADLALLTLLDVAR
jgi:hypothetical protein